MDHTANVAEPADFRLLCDPHSVCMKSIILLAAMLGWASAISILGIMIGTNFTPEEISAEPLLNGIKTVVWVNTIILGVCAIVMIFPRIRS